MSVCWSSTTRTSVRRKQSARCAVRASVCTSCSSLRSTAAWAAARSTSIGSASAWPRSTSGSPPRSSRPSSAATRSASAATAEQNARTGWAGSPRRACCSPTAPRSPRPGSDLGALKTIADPVEATTGRRRLSHHRAQAVDLQRRRGRPLHDPGLAPGGPSWFVVEPAPTASPTASTRTSTASG